VGRLKARHPSEDLKTAADGPQLFARTTSDHVERDVSATSVRHSTLDAVDPGRQCYRSRPQTFLRDFFLRQIAFGFDQKAFFDDPLMFLERTLDLVCVIAVPIWHQGNDPVVAGSRVTDKHVRNTGNDFTHPELVHRLIPTFDDLPVKAPNKLRQKNGGTRLFL